MTVGTALLLFSSLFVVLALYGAQKGNRKMLLGWLGATILCGMFFVGMQVYEFTHFVHKGLTLQRNLFGASFFALTGFHGTHVTHRRDLAGHACSSWRSAGKLPPEQVAQPRDRRAVLALRGRGLDRDLPRRLPDQVRTDAWTAHAPRDREHEHDHPTPGTYAKIGLVLFVLTALEVGLYEVTYGEHAGALGASLQPFFIPLLLLLSAVKFALVAMFYMHLKNDSKLFSGVFVFPLIIATVIILGADRARGVPLGLRALGVTLAAARAARSTSGRGRLVPYECGLVAAPQRSPRHRAPRCPVLLRDRTAAPPARPGPAGAGLAGGLASAPACCVLLVALNGPMHDLSDYYLFSVHMVQHLLLTLAVAAAPDRWGRRAGCCGRCSGRPAVRAVARVLTHPVVAAVIYTVTIAVWHLAPYYDLMMRNHDVHIATHLMFMVTATIMWWPVMSPVPELPRLPLRARACSTCSWSGSRCRSSPRSSRSPTRCSIPGTPWRRGPGASRRSTTSSSAACSCGCRGTCGCSWRSACCSSSGRQETA